MDWKKKLSKLTAASMAAFALFVPTAFAAEGDATEAPAAQTQERQQLSPEEVLEVYQNQGYKHTSQRYGYSIICPMKPNVIPASLIVEGARGEVLIFNNQEYEILNGWLVLTDAFDEEEVPKDLGTRKEPDQKAFIDHLMNTAGYAMVRLMEVAGNTGIYAVTAKEVDIDTNGDGVMDDTLVADTQTVKAFFRGQYGGKFSVQLIDNPELTRDGVALYELGLLTFQEWPTTVGDDKKPQDKKQDKKDQKEKKQDKQDKKDKKDKKNKK